MPSSGFSTMSRCSSRNSRISLSSRVTSVGTVNGTKRVIENFLRRSGDRPDPLAQLTPRQREILQLIAEGRSTKEIAFTLNLSVKTVETHRAQLMERLEIRDVPGLVRYAMRTGLISSEQ